MNDVRDVRDEIVVAHPEVHQEPTPPPSDSRAASSAEAHIPEQQNIKRMDIDDETMAPDMLSPMSADGEKHEENELPALSSAGLSSPSMGYDFSNVRVRPWLT
jgi:hypothetical protein